MSTLREADQTKSDEINSLLVKRQELILEKQMKIKISNEKKSFLMMTQKKKEEFKRQLRRD